MGLPRLNNVKEGSYLKSKLNLQDLGWNDHFATLFQPYLESGYKIGRISTEHKNRFQVFTEIGEIWATVSGKMRYSTLERNDFPAVGDWVVLDYLDELTGYLDSQVAIIQAVLPRNSKFSRKSAGKTSEEQIIATNIDTVFLVNALNLDFNIRRIERYLTLAWESGAMPVILLSKSDLCEDVQAKLLEVEACAPGVPIHPISCLTGDGIDELKHYVEAGQTVALLGSSGAGKSTLVNQLFGLEIQKTKEVREADNRGRHTTTSRELFVLPQGGLLIDTPGMRELQLYGTGDGLYDAFEDIYEYASQCRFSDCQHETEPGCAIHRALAEGSLVEDRYESFKKLQKEASYISRKANLQEHLEEKKKWKKINQELKEHNRSSR